MPISIDNILKTKGSKYNIGQKLASLYSKSNKLRQEVIDLKKEFKQKGDVNNLQIAIKNLEKIMDIFEGIETRVKMAVQ